MIGEVERLATELADRYTIERELGSGGMAIVYLARDRKHDRLVALKVLRPELTTSIGTERFLREIQFAAKLTHPNILALYDSGEAAGLLYYVMPYVAGESLRDRLKRETHLPVEDALQITREVAEALGHAHSLGIIHRDIKPENILLEAGHAVVSDFGIARAVSAAGGTSLTATGLAMGTPAYMSPEQAMGAKGVDGRSDIYSLACVLYEMLGGEPPFTGPTPQAIMARHSMEKVPSITIIRPAAPPAIQHAIERALSKTPADRFANTQQFVDALAASTDETLAVPRAVRRSLPRIPKLALGAIAVAALAVLAWQFRPAPAPVVATGRLVVLPFNEHGDREIPLDLQGQSLAYLLTIEFDNTARYRPEPVGTVIRQAERLCPGPLELQCGLRVAEALGAELFVTGHVDLFGDSVTLSARMQDVAGDQAMRPVTISGDTAETYRLLDGLARGLLVAPATGVAERVTALAGATTDSPDALRAYVSGEHFLREWELRPATEAFKRATEIDSMFALAWYRLAFLYDWWEDVQAPATSRRAQSLADRLPARNRRHLAAHVAMTEGNPTAAEPIYLELLEENPNDVEVLSELGELRWAYNWRLGRSRAEAIEPLARALELDPSHPFAGSYLAWSLAVESRIDAMDSLATAQGDPVFALATDALEAMRASDSVALSTARDSITRLPPSAAMMAAEAIFAGDLHGGVPDLAFLVSTVRPYADSARLTSYCSSARCFQYLSTYAFAKLAPLELGRGRWAATRETLATMSALGYTPALEYLTLLATLPMVQPTRAELDSLRVEIEAWNVEADIPEVAAHRYNLTNHLFRPHLQLYLLGLLASITGDYVTARDLARQIESQGPAPHLPTIGEDLALGVRADVLLREGRPADALAALEAAPRRVHYGNAWDSPFTAGEREAFLRAQVLDSLGRHEEAIEWYANTLEGLYFLGPALLAPSHLKRGEIYEKLGDRTEALRHYAAFVELWRDADAAYQPIVDDVRSRIARLRPD